MFPHIVLNTSKTAPALKRIFNYEARCYNLLAYERVSPGLGARVWKMIQDELAHQEWLQAHQ